MILFDELTVRRRGYVETGGNRQPGPGQTGEGRALASDDRQGGARIGESEDVIPGEGIGQGQPPFSTKRVRASRLATASAFLVGLKRARRTISATHWR